jgi:5,10-methylenetetrahydromethanopterin reductase
MTFAMTTSQYDRAATGLALRDAWPWRELHELVGTAEETGYSALFLPEIAGRESFSTLAALAGETSRMDLGTGVVTMGSRRPLVTAMAAATLDERSSGRAILGLGAGRAAAGALGRLREYVEAVRALLQGGSIDDGAGSSIRLSMPPPPDRPIPIWTAALGPRSMTLAGEIADGVLLNWCTPERVAFARRRVEEGAEAAGRDPRSISIGVYLRACVGADADAAIGALRAAAAEYASIPAYARQFEACGLGGGATAAARAREAGDVDAVPLGFVRAIALTGTAGDAASRLRAYRDAGASLPIVYPVPALDALSSVLGTTFALSPNPVLQP